MLRNLRPLLAKASTRPLAPVAPRVAKYATEAPKVELDQSNENKTLPLHTRAVEECVKEQGPLLMTACTT